MEPFKFHSPTIIAIYAPPYSGKSTLTRKILEHGDELFMALPSFTVYCYKEWLLMFDEMKHSVKGLILHKGVPSREKLRSGHKENTLYWCWMICNKYVKGIEKWQKCLQ